MAMSTQTNIYIALGLLAAVGGGVYLTQKQEQKQQQRLTVSGKSAELPKFSIKDDEKDKVTKIIIKNADKPEVVLEKQGEGKDAKWKLTKPVDYPANQQHLTSLVANLKEPVTKELIDSSEASYKEYKLDDAQALHLQVFKGSEKILDNFYGKSGGRGQMVRKAGNKGIYSIKGYSSYLYSRDVNAWRDKEISKFDDKDVTEVSIKNENGDYLFSKDGETWKASKAKEKKKGDLERFDENKVKDMIRAFKTLNAEDFADDISDSDSGLDKPASLLTFKLKDGKSLALSVGKTKEHDARYLKMGDGKQVYIISSWAAGWAVADDKKFQKPDEKKDGKDKDKDKKGAKGPDLKQPIKLPPAPGKGH
jgi:hypothetical protein